MTRTRLPKTYRSAISGLGISEIALGCCIFCFGLGTAEVTNNDPTFSNIFYLSITATTSILVVVCGSVAVNTAKYCTTTLILVTIALSTLATLFTIVLLGLQTYSIYEYNNRTDVNAFTFSSLVLGCVASGTSFFLCFTNICLTCNAGGACGGTNEVKPYETYANRNVSPYESNINGIPPVSLKQSGILPLHEVRPDTAKIIKYWNNGVDYKKMKEEGGEETK